MKLIKCHIENFGTLHLADIDFNNGLTVIKEDNGFGKSTLAMFIKSMFYGLPQTTKRSIDENDRKKYTPWQGGAFGGTLDFEIGDKQYRIERYFATKEKDDTCTVYDLKTNKSTIELTDDIGGTLFGIDAESFERSIYMPQTKVSTEMNNSLRAKLTGLVENSDDISNFDNAVSALEKRIREYSVLNGARGAIADKSAEIQHLQQKKNDAQTAAENLQKVLQRLDGHKRQREKFSNEIIEIRKKITALSEQAATLEQAKRREEWANNLSTLNNKAASLKLRYPNGLPSEVTLQEMSDTAKMYSEAVAEIGVLKSDSADRQDLEAINGYFGNNVPTEQEISDCRTLINQNIRDKASAEALAVQLDGENETITEDKKSVKPLVILAIVLAVLGGVAMVWQLVIGIIVLVLGLVLFGAGGFVYLKNMIFSNNVAKKDLSDVRRDYDSLIEKIDLAEKRILEFTSRFSDLEPSIVLETVAQNLRDRAKLSKSVADAEQKLASKQDRAAGCKQDLTEFFSKYGIGLEGDFSDLLNTVKADCKLADEVANGIAEAERKLAEIPETVLLAASDTAISDKDELVKKENETNLQLSALDEEISSLEVSARKLTADCDGIDVIEEDLENAKEQKAEMERKFLVLKTTLELLKASKNDLSLKYLDRMTKGFEKYSGIIMGEDQGSLINTDLEVRLDKNGASRDKEFFSRGVRDMIDIAMRMALTDALYDGEKPMLILDDPFVNLDDRRLSNAMSLLKKLAQEQQIIYLTCHSSRC